LFSEEIIHPASAILDYILAYAAVGLAGLFKSPDTNKKSSLFRIFFGTLFGVMARFALHVLSGVAIFSSYISPGWNPWSYSLIYNASYLLPELILSLIIIFSLQKFNIFHKQN
jgi:thiamine transporter